MFDYIPDMFAAETADSEDEGDQWYDDHISRPAPARSSCPATRWPASINTEVKAGPGQPARRRLPRHRHPPHAPSTSAGASPRCTTSSRSWPASTSRPRPWRSARPATTSWAGCGSTPTPRRPRCRGCSPPARWPAGCTAPTGSAATRSPTSWCSAAGPASAPPSSPRAGGERRPSTRARSTPPSMPPWPPSSGTAARTPTTLQHDLQDTMQSLVGIIRTGSELEEALGKLDELEDRARRIVAQRRPQATTPGGTWPPTFRPCSPCPRCTALGAINRKESRGGHTRDDYPKPVAELGTVNFVQRIKYGGSDGWWALRRSGASPSPRSRSR